MLSLFANARAHTGVKQRSSYNAVGRGQASLQVILPTYIHTHIYTYMHICWRCSTPSGVGKLCYRSFYVCMRTQLATACGWRQQGTSLRIGCLYYTFNAYTHKFIHTHIHTYIHIYTYVCVCVCVCVCIHASFSSRIYASFSSHAYM